MINDQSTTTTEFTCCNTHRYLVYQRPGCPRSPQAFPQPCLVEDAEQVYSGPDLEFTATDLVPYTTYDFQVRVENTQGLGDFGRWVNTQTETAGKHATMVAPVDWRLLGLIFPV